MIFSKIFGLGDRSPQVSSTSKESKVKVGSKFADKLNTIFKQHEDMLIKDLMLKFLTTRYPREVKVYDRTLEEYKNSMPHIFFEGIKPEKIAEYYAKNKDTCMLQVLAKLAKTSSYEIVDMVCTLPDQLNKLKLNKLKYKMIRMTTMHSKEKIAATVP